METLKQILVVSRMVKYDAAVIRTGASPAHAYGAHLTIIHVTHDPFGIEGWNLPMPNLAKEYRSHLKKTREEGHLEHFLFGRSNHDLVLKMPCSLQLVKKEPTVAAGPWGS